ncbi:MAG TPA: bifunctional demethylmenaquinone methyltransferase/2-methoxy-6-polyprenyl-1,4-benzoquinol methylase UbiE [Acidobacteriota bacterium]|nr:bifunctional demethylmenaquinone methyltransferase/2-methoxy-6-polyprenyl-1,4-benzoquinol methylase UbiE [Acidobacteriota bacterium]
MSQVDKQAGQVRRMFDAIAPRYDLLNRLLSLSVDRYWRRIARKRLAQLQPDPSSIQILDLCTGTGDLAFEMARLGSVVGCDFSHSMLVLGRKKERRRRARVRFVEGDVLRLPLPDSIFDAVTIAFGLRNLEDLRCGLQEVARVMKKGATLLVLEFSIPTIPVFRSLYLFYFTRILPLIGNLISRRRGPYSYLPASVREFPPPPELAQIIQECGFTEVSVESLTGGIASLYLARRTE